MRLHQHPNLPALQFLHTTWEDSSKGNILRSGVNLLADKEILWSRQHLYQICVMEMTMQQALSSAMYQKNV